MTRSLGPIFFACDAYRLASVVIWMTVTPIPIRGLLFRFRFSKGTIFLVFIPAILTVGMVFVGIPRSRFALGIPGSQRVCGE
jgi:hypothetical protein